MNGRAAVWTACVVAMMVGSAPAQTDDRTRVFDAGPERVLTVTRAALKSFGWDIEKEDRAEGWLRTDVRRMDGDDFGVYATGTKHRLRLVFKNLPDGRTSVTIERRVWKEERILWMDKRVDLSTTDHQLETEILDTIGSML